MKKTVTAILAILLAFSTACSANPTTESAPSRVTPTFSPAPAETASPMPVSGETEPDESAQPAAESEPLRVKTEYSPDGRYLIEGYGVDPGEQVSGFSPVREIRVVEADSGLTVWKTEGLFLLYREPQFCWSPDSRYVSAAYSGRSWTDALIVDTADLSEHPLPGLTELAPLFPASGPDGSRPDPSIVPQRWANDTTLEVAFSWRVNYDTEDGLFYGEYTYNVQTGEFAVR